MFRTMSRRLQPTFGRCHGTYSPCMVGAAPPRQAHTRPCTLTSTSRLRSSFDSTSRRKFVYPSSSASNLNLPSQAPSYSPSISTWNTCVSWKTRRCFSSSVENCVALNYQKISPSNSQQPSSGSSSTATPLFVLHGLFGAGQNWRTFAKSLVETTHRDCYLVDLRNHGSSPHTDTMSIEDMVGDVEELITSLGVEKIALMGHSMGGKVAMQFVADHGDLIERLCIVDIAPVQFQASDQHQFIEAMRRVDLKQITKRQQVEQQLMADVPDKTIRQFLLTNLSHTGEQYRWRIHLDGIASGLKPLRVHVPKRPRIDGGAGESDATDPVISTCHTTFIRGGNSDYILPEHLPIIDAMFPNASVHTIDECGHWPHFEKPKQFLSLVGSFLAPEGTDE